MQSPVFQYAAALIFGYLCGSIPFGVLLTRFAGAPDLRTVGSGNIGATNVLRTGRKFLAAATLAGGSSPLTARERDVLVAARDGATVADIAARLFLSEGTVRNYLSGAIAKCQVRNRVEAVRMAEEHGWL